MKRFLPILTILFLSLVASGSVVIHVRGRGFQQAPGGPSYWTDPYAMLGHWNYQTTNAIGTPDVTAWANTISNMPTIATGPNHRFVVGTNAYSTIKYGCDYDGSDDYQRSETLAQYNTPTGTVAVWFWLDQNNERTESLIHINKRTGTTATDFIISPDSRDVNPDFIDIWLRTAGTMQWRFSTPANSLDPLVTNWAHIVVVQDGTAPVCYINGILQTLTWVTTTDKTKWIDDLLAATPASDTLCVGAGRYNGGTVRPTDGKIADVRIYAQVLASNEVYNLWYNTRLPTNWMETP